MAMGMGVDQPGMHQQAGRIEDRRALGRRKVAADGMDDAILDQQIGRLAAPLRGIRQQRAANEQESLFADGHAALPQMPAPGVPAPLDHGNSRRSASETSWNSTIPMMASSTTAPKASGVRKKAIEVWIR